MSEDLSDFSLLELFREEAETQLATLASGLVALESATDPKPVLDELMRAAHSIKGAARIVGIDQLVKLAHAGEDLFVAVQRGTLTLDAGAIDVLLRSVDAIAAVARGESVPDTEIDTLLAQLARVRAGEALPAAANAAPPPPDAPASTAIDTEPEPDPVPPEPQAPASDGTPRPRADTSIRMTAEAIERLTALAAESVVESGRLEQLVERFGEARAQQDTLARQLDALHVMLDRQATREQIADALAATTRQFERCRQLLDARDQQLEHYSRRTTALANRLSRETLASRMRPFGSILRGYPRLVRDLARDLGKRCRLELRGESTRVDREILDLLDAPLNHLVRNAMDHGLEPEQVRAACGKPPEGHLTLNAYHHSGRLRVVVSDDGRGIDTAALRDTVVARRLATQEAATALPEAELLEFLFLPGFSTAARVTELSGRGVGLDAVRTMIQQAGGSIAIRTTKGTGTEFDIELPVTRAVLRTLVVDIGGARHALPLARLEHVLMLEAGAVRTVEGRPCFAWRGEDVALVHASVILESTATAGFADRFGVAVLRDGNHVWGLVVDGFHGEQRLVVRPLDPRFGHVPDVAAISTDETGAIVFILDVDALLRSIDALISGGRLLRPLARSAQSAKRQAQRILVVDDSLTVRQAQRQLLQNAGYAVDVAVDGVEGWSAVRLVDYDLVVSDVDMPRLNGIELVRRIRADGTRSHLPIVIVSYKDRDEDRLAGLEAGANHFIAKRDFHDNELLQVVHDLIGPAPAEDER